jgi:opacity protein-like surface antigen
MKKALAVTALAVLAAVLTTAAAAAQPTASTYVPFNPCRLFNSQVSPGTTLSAGSTTYILARGSCNIPQSANAVALTLTATGATAAGSITVWESSLPLPTPNSMSFRGNGTDSSFTIARLCYPVEECAGEDLAIRVTSAASHVILDVVGYFEPL